MGGVGGGCVSSLFFKLFLMTPFRFFSMNHPHPFQQGVHLNNDRSLTLLHDQCCLLGVSEKAEMFWRYESKRRSRERDWAKPSCLSRVVWGHAPQENVDLCVLCGGIWGHFGARAVNWKIHVSIRFFYRKWLIYAVANHLTTQIYW